MKQSLRISLGLIFVLCFGVAFVCASDTSGTNTASSSTNLDIAAAEKISFVSDRDGNNEIYVMDSDGSIKLV